MINNCLQLVLVERCTISIFETSYSEKRLLSGAFRDGLNASWDISSLYKNKNKLNEAKIQRQQVAINRDLETDRVKTEVHESYVRYHLALDRIKILQTAITQATENERVMESKFHNNLATTTDRIDAQTLLYQSRINLELAKSDATIAYYSLLNSVGHIQ